MRALYRTDHTDLFPYNFSNALSAVGVSSGDVIFVHSDIAAFGKLAAANGTELETILVEILLQSVGETGTVVMPTFTYSFTKGETFDRQHSKSIVGSLTEFFRTYPGVVRNAHPLFSVAAHGPATGNLCHVNNDSFGTGSVFDVLEKLDAKILFFGATFASCTFSHHLEQTAGVPYRFFKNFNGTIIDNGISYEETCRYFVRPLDGSITLNLERLEKHLCDKGLITKAKVGSGFILAVRAREIMKEGLMKLQENPYFLIEEQPIEITR